MNMKKIIAGVAAAALAVGAMAVAASAADYQNTYTQSVTADKLNKNDDGTFYSQVQVGHVSEVTVTAKYTTADGATGYALIGNNWGDPTEEANGVTITGAWNGAGLGLPEDVVEAAAGDFSTITIDFTMVVTDIAADVQAQADAWGEDAIADIQILVLNPGSPYASGFGTVKITEDAPADNGATEGTGSDPDKGNADTGVEGVAVVAGLAIIAAGAVVVAKKRG